MVEEIKLAREDFSWFVEQARKAPPPNARLERALRELEELTTEKPDGTVAINWRPRAKMSGAARIALPPELDGPMAENTEAQAEQIVGLATWLNMGQRDLALRWFDTPIDELGGKSPRQLVSEGHADAIRNYVLSISSGTVG